MKCGIEIHQRIAGRKLFCNCVPLEEPQGEKAAFSRYLHAVRSELGELDAAARLEQMRGRRIIYEAPLCSSCLVEADEEPPHSLNPEALFAVLVFCSLLSSKPVDEVHIMRKNVIDGSNTSGFQRTAIVGIGGVVKTSFGQVPIETVCIEEESAGILPSQKESTAGYELSRLGIPLVEIATAPVFSSGRQAQEAALAIGSLLRKTGLVCRGIGTIRQDINVSIPGGARVEIKGVQELSMIEKTVELEAERQKALLSIIEALKQRPQPLCFDEAFVDLTEIFSETSCQLISKSAKSGARVFGLRLPSHEGLLGTKIAPDRRYGTELADYARTAGVRGLVHSDEELSKYGLSDDEIAEVRMALSVQKGDAFVLVVGEAKKAQMALGEVLRRAKMLSLPEETRKANPDGTSSYLRPLPGRARMYPETDIPPVEITAEMLADCAWAVKQLLREEEEKESLLSSIPQELSKQLSSARGLLGGDLPNPELSAFCSAIKAGVEPKLAASAITNVLQALKREGADTKKISQERLLDALLAVKQGSVAKAALGEVLREMCASPQASALQAAKKLDLLRISGKELEALLQKEGGDFSSLMAKYRLRVDAQEAQELLRRITRK
ncbi:MAG: Glu-tRNA(Gln) amidotransferase subunit GatE [Candidatus Micrarchaeota archaeon]|nr:Glu-tRNA(Gln) amidotransferase subunit GatE [Candidatus Micrarchaeota archaeon]